MSRMMLSGGFRVTCYSTHPGNPGLHEQALEEAQIEAGLGGLKLMRSSTRSPSLGRCVCAHLSYWIALVSQICAVFVLSSVHL
jgi:hypothetical protein